MNRFALAFVLLLAACGAGKAPAAPQPQRPKAEPRPVDPGPGLDVPDDCEPSKDSLGSKTYKERSIDESADYAKEGMTKLAGADAPGIEESTKQALIRDAVEDLIAALVADPYNVEATYSLAATYAEIKRPQCSLNMLSRLIQMRTHTSKKTAVEAKLDELLGRKKKTVDSRFRSLRTDQRYRDLIEGICAGSNDPGCSLDR
jgi:hypothetical protein